MYTCIIYIYIIYIYDKNEYIHVSVYVYIYNYSMIYILLGKIRFIEKNSRISELPTVVSDSENPPFFPMFHMNQPSLSTCDLSR